MNRSWNAYLVPPADFAGADDIIINFVKERDPGIEIIERTPEHLNCRHKRRLSSCDWFVLSHQVLPTAQHNKKDIQCMYRSLFWQLHTFIMALHTKLYTSDGFSWLCKYSQMPSSRLVLKKKKQSSLVVLVTSLQEQLLMR